MACATTRKVILANAALAIILALLLLWNIRGLSRTPAEESKFRNTTFVLPERTAPERLASVKHFFGPEEISAGKAGGGGEGAARELKMTDYSVRLEGTILAHGDKIAMFLLLPKKGKKGAKELRCKIGEGGELFGSTLERIESHQVLIRCGTSGETVRLLIFKNDAADL